MRLLAVLLVVLMCIAAVAGVSVTRGDWSGGTKTHNISGEHR